jgi:hypothetical protein
LQQPTAIKVLQSTMQAIAGKSFSLLSAASMAQPSARLASVNNLVEIKSTAASCGELVVTEIGAEP